MDYLLTDQEEPLRGLHPENMRKLTPEADQEINEAVARKLGWRETNKVMGDPTFGIIVPKGTLHDPSSMRYHLPDYCHDIAAAWEVMEYLYSKAYDCQVYSKFQKPAGWCFQATPRWGTLSQLHGEADTAPMAICSAFLKLPEKEP